ncbi:SurA N-terminal domain-containing protein [Patescibacteria group bacterium]
MKAVKKINKDLKKKIPVKFKLNKSVRNVLIVFLLALVVGGIFWRFKHYLIAASVNNQPIYRLSIISELEKQAGQQALESLVAKELVFQQAKKLNVSVAEVELKGEIAKIEEQFSTQDSDLDSLLEVQGRSREDLLEEIKIQLLIEKILGKEVEVTDQEVADYYEENQDLFPEESTFEELEQNLQDQLRQQKLGEKVPAWLEEIKAQANIKYFLKY